MESLCNWCTTFCSSPLLPVRVAEMTKPSLHLSCIVRVWFGKFYPLCLMFRPLFCITDVLRYRLVGLVMCLLPKCLAVAPFYLLVVSFYKWNKWGLEPKRNPNNVRNSFLLLSLVSLAGGALRTKSASTALLCVARICRSPALFQYFREIQLAHKPICLRKNKKPEETQLHGNKARQWTVDQNSFKCAYLR